MINFTPKSIYKHNNKDMKRVLIMLATYNGEKFLCEQLDSIYNQEDVRIHILARDDGSSDSTIRILEDYAEKYGRMTIIKGENVGAIRNFFLLVQYAVNNMADFDYYAFSDQDDFWFKNKLIVSVTELDKCSNDIRLFCSAEQAADQNLTPLKSMPPLFNNNLASALVASQSGGCTQVMSVGLLKIVNHYSKLPDGRRIMMHDAVVNILAYAMHADIVQHHEPVMYYRLHGNNVVGRSRNIVSLTIGRIKRLINQDPNYKSDFADQVLYLYGDMLPTDSKIVLSKFAHYRNSFSKRMSLLFSKEVYNQSCLDSCGTFFLILFGLL